MKAFLKIAKILCYICSFPLFMICAIIASKANIESGSSYGLGSYSGVIVSVLFTVIWAVMVIVMETKIKKKTVNKAQKIKKQTTKQVVFSLLLACGLMFVLDGVLPSIFAGLTSSTIFYEDIAESESAQKRAEYNKEMLDTIIARNVLNGVLGGEYFSYYKTSGEFGSEYTGLPIDSEGRKLKMSKYGYYVTADSYDEASGDGTVKSYPVAKTTKQVETMKAYFQNTIDKYCKEGMKNEEVAALMNRDGKNNLFASINLSGYESWIGSWVDLANDARMTLPVVLNLVLANRQTIQSDDATYGTPAANDDTTRLLQPELIKMPYYNVETDEITYIQYGWTVLDMMGDYSADPYQPAAALAVDLSGLLGGSDLWSLLKNIELGGSTLDSLLGENTIDNLLNDGLTINLGVTTLSIPAIYTLIDDLLASVSYAVGNPNVAGTPDFTGEGDTTNSGWMYGFAPLYLKLTNADGSTVHADISATEAKYYANVGDAPTQLGIYTNNYGRGQLDYMRMGWTDSNGLIFIITGLFCIRKVCYVFSGITVLMAIIVGAIRLKLLELDKPLVQSVATQPLVTESASLDDSYDYTPDEAAASTEVYQDPYMSAYQDTQTSYDVPYGNN